MTRVTMGSPVRIYSVNADGLRQFEKDGNLETLLVDSHLMLTPVLVRWESSILIGAGGGQELWDLHQPWHVTMRGMPQLRILTDNSSNG